MQLFGLFGTQKVRPSWSYNVKGVIWRIHPTAGGALIGEERRIEEKKALFFCLDRENGRELWQHPSPGDDWWVGIETVYRDTILLHGFANPNLPLHRGIIVVDTLTGKKLWEDRELQFTGIAEDSVIGSKETAAGQSYVELDRRSGAKRKGLDATDLPSLGLNRLGQEAEIKLPVPLVQLASGDPQIEAAIRNHYDAGNLAGPVEAVEQSGFVIFDYHEVSGHGTAQDPYFSSAVKVVELATGTLVYSDTVSTGIRAVIPELFFVQHDMLYYIKERRMLMAVRLAL